MTAVKMRRTIASWINLIIGWFHFLFSTALAMGLLYYLIFYYERPHDNPKIAAFGLPVLLAIFLFSFSSFIFDILLITGILARRVNLISAFVIGNYMVLGFLMCCAVFFFAEDYVHKDTTVGNLINPLMHGLTLVTMVYLFYPVYLLVQQTRLPPTHEHQILDETEVLAKPSKHGKPVNKHAPNKHHKPTKPVRPPRPNIQVNKVNC
ncbi:uncharacterized protein [Musca autumnalis]|uniref:uncharacterized protein n=1 Tax=Musca autumnalis TaxID=221902 RepID=UPI003CF08F21